MITNPHYSSSEVMKLAWSLYRANKGDVGSRDLFAACLSSAHSILRRRATESAVVTFRRVRRVNALARIERATSKLPVLVLDDDMRLAA